MLNNYLNYLKSILKSIIMIRATLLIGKLMTTIK